MKEADFQSVLTNLITSFEENRGTGLAADALAARVGEYIQSLRVTLAPGDPVRIKKTGETGYLYPFDNPYTLNGVALWVVVSSSRIGRIANDNGGDFTADELEKISPDEVV